MTESQDQLSARIIVLNYKGAELLPQCLPSIVEAARHASYPTQVTVLNNPGGQDGLDYVEKQFPEVHIERSPVNRILCSYNDYVKKVKESVVILLNNDIRVDKNFVDPLVDKFKDDPNAFLAAPRVMTFDGEAIEAAKSKAGIRFGLFWCNARYPGYQEEAMLPSETYSSGFGAFSRQKFVELGGYDDRYLPGIMEDVDLCFQAHQLGYRLYYAPTSVLFHIGRASFKKAFGERETNIVAHRNTFLFMWKNFKGFTFWVSHIFFLPFRLLFAAARGNWAMILGFLRAVRTVQR